MNKEIWKDIASYCGKYQVSSLGRIKSLSRKIESNKNTYFTTEKILKGRPDKDGYLRVALRDGKKTKEYYIHRLVANAFLENKYNFPQINHKNENVLDNRVSNLEWCSCKYNINYGTRTQRMKETKRKMALGGF